MSGQRETLLQERGEWYLQIGLWPPCVHTRSTYIQAGTRVHTLRVPRDPSQTKVGNKTATLPTSLFALSQTLFQAKEPHLGKQYCLFKALLDLPSFLWHQGGASLGI